MLVLFSADTEHALVLKFLCGAFMIGFNLMLFLGSFILFFILLDKLWFSRYHQHEHHSQTTSPEPIETLPTHRVTSFSYIDSKIAR